MITGNSLESEMNQYIFSPLNLENTSFPVSGTSMPDPHPKGYFIGEFDSEYPEFSEHFDISWAQAAGCVISNIHDLKKFVIGMNNEFYLKGYFGHGGDIAGFSSAMFHSMEKNCTVIIWYNSLLNEVRPMHQLVKFDEIIFERNYN